MRRRVLLASILLGALGCSPRGAVAIDIARTKLPREATGVRTSTRETNSHGAWFASTVHELEAQLTEPEARAWCTALGWRIDAAEERLAGSAGEPDEPLLVWTAPDEDDCGGSFVFRVPPAGERAAVMLSILCR